MNANNNKKAITVGVFVVIGLLIFLAGILTLGGQKKTFEKKVEIRALFDDVGGLQEGNNVWFSGVKIGAVKNISFTPDNKVEVVMNIEKKASPFIKKDVKAKISSEGFIGNKIVLLYGGTPAAGSISKGDLIAVEKGLSTDEILATFQENNKNLLDITGNIKQITERLEAGQGSVGKLLTDETLVNTLQAAATKLRLASSNAEQLTAHISDYAAKLQSKGSLSNDIITDTVVFSSLRRAVSQLRQVATTANEITDNLKLVSGNIKQASNNLNSNNSPIGVLLNDKQAGDDLKKTLSSLQSGTQKLDENLEALQHNFLLRGFFKKKEKEKEKEKEK